MISATTCLQGLANMENLAINVLDLSVLTA